MMFPAFEYSQPKAVTKRRRTAMFAGFFASILILLALVCRQAQGQDRNSGYYFTYTCSAPDGKNRADRVSNVYYSHLNWVKRQERARAVLGGYKGCMGDMGAYQTASQAEQYRTQFYSGIPRFSLPDPLQ